MDTQTAPARNIDVAHGSVEGAEEEHHEKSPMFRKMKDRVKKIKNTITKKVHDQGGHQEHGNLDEGDDGHDDDEEMVDPETHGPPIYDSSSPRAREATTQNRPNAVGGSDELSDTRARVESAQNRPNAVSGSDESSHARARVESGEQNRPNARAAPDESQNARARVGFAQDRPAAIRGPDESSAQDRPNAVGGSDESSEARARVGTAHDQLIGVGSTDERSDERARVKTAEDRPNAIEGHDKSSDGRARVGTDQDRLNAVGDPEESSDGRASTAQDRLNAVGDPDESSDGRARVGTAQDRSSGVRGHVGDGAAGLGLITPEIGEDPAPPKTSPTEAATAKEHNKAGEEFEVPPELSRSFEAMAVSNQAQDQPEDVDQLSKDKNSSYTGKISSAKDAAVSAASMVYGKVAEAGTAVMAKVKPEAGKVDGGEHENLGKTQDKGVSMKDYLVQKLTPGEDDKALSAQITEAVHKKKDAAPVTPPPREVTESGEAGGGIGVVGKMRETVTSFLGGGGSSPKSAPATDESPTKVAAKTDEVQKKDAAPREVTASDEAGGGMGMVGKIRETVTSFLGGGGSSPKSPPATESRASVAEDTKDLHSRPTDAVSQEKVLE